MRVTFVPGVERERKKGPPLDGGGGRDIQIEQKGDGHMRAHHHQGPAVSRLLKFSLLEILFSLSSFSLTN